MVFIFLLLKNLVNDFLLWLQLHSKEYDVIIVTKREKKCTHASATMPFFWSLIILKRNDVIFVHFTLFVETIIKQNAKNHLESNWNFFYYSILRWRAHIKWRMYTSAKLKRNVEFKEFCNHLGSYDLDPLLYVIKRSEMKCNHMEQMSH